MTPDTSSDGPSRTPSGDDVELAPCGIDCAACNTRRAANDAQFAEQLAAKWRQSGQPKATADWFKCQGCRGPSELVWSEGCAIRACCIGQRHLDNCGQCEGFPCDHITRFETDGYKHHAQAVKRLREMRATEGNRGA